MVNKAVQENNELIKINDIVIFQCTADIFH